MRSAASERESERERDGERKRGEQESNVLCFTRILNKLSTGSQRQSGTVKMKKLTSFSSKFITSSFLAIVTHVCALHTAQC